LYCPTLVTLLTLRGIGAESLFGPAFAAQKACSKKPVDLLISEPMLPAQIVFYFLFIIGFLCGFCTIALLL
jgi:hypothetical protein